MQEWNYFVRKCGFPKRERRNSTGNEDKKIYENGLKWWNKGKTLKHYGTKKKKNNTRENNNTTWGNKSKGTGERRKIKKITRKSRTIQTKQDIPKQRKKIRGDDTKTYQQLEAREAEQLRSWIWQPRAHNQKAEWISNMTKMFVGPEEVLKAEIHIDFHRTIQNKNKLENNMDPG